MIEFTLRHPLDCTPDRHWELFFDPDWTRDLLTEGLSFICEVGEVKQEGTTWLRDMKVAPKVELPKAVAKLLGDKLGYTERGRYDSTKRVWSYELVLNVLSSKIKMGGEMHLEPRGAEGSTRVSKMWVKVSIFGIGGMVEKAAEHNMRDGWDKSATWINGWLAKNPSQG